MGQWVLWFCLTMRKEIDWNIKGAMLHFNVIFDNVVNLSWIIMKTSHVVLLFCIAKMRSLTHYRIKWPYAVCCPSICLKYQLHLVKTPSQCLAIHNQRLCTQRKYRQAI